MTTLLSFAATAVVTPSRSAAIRVAAFLMLHAFMLPSLCAAVTLKPAGNGHRSLAYAADGRLGELVAETVTDTEGQSNTRLLYRERTPGANPAAWEEIGSGLGFGIAALQYTSTDQATVIYLDNTHRFRRVLRGTSGGWTAGSVWVMPSPYAELWMDAGTFAFEPDGTPHVLLLLTDFSSRPLLAHVRLAEPVNQAEWTTVGGPFTGPTEMKAFDYPGFQNLDYVRMPRHLSLALDASGGAHVVYSVDQTSVPVVGGTQVRSSLFYVMKPAAGAWSAPQTLLSPGAGYGDAGLGASIAVAPDGTVAVASAYLPRAATGSPGDCVLRYLVKQANGTWTDTTAASAADNYQAGDGPQGTGLEQQLVFDEQSRPRITFTDHASEHFGGSGASSFSGQVRLATRTAAASGSWTLSKLVNRGSLTPLDFQTFRPAIAARHGQTAVAATSWSWNQGQNTYVPNYQIVLTGTVTVVTNPPPGIGNIADLSTPEDTATAALPFTVSDANTPLTSLTLSATSSNAALVPAGNVLFGGSAGARTVTVTPAANQAGTSTITVTVSDGAGTASDSFVLTVTAVNDAPVISALADVQVNEDTGTGALAFTISDVETVAGSLTVTRATSNTALVPLANVVLGGSGGARTVTVTPAANQSGTATITVTVSDGTTPQSRAFLLTVLPVNDLPTISNVASQTTNEDTATSAIAVTIGDLETAAAALTVSGSSSNATLVLPGGFAFGGNGTARTCTITPAPDQSGTATITLTVSDGAATATDTFTLTVTAVNDAPVIADMADFTMPKNTTSAALPFTVSDPETAAASLTVTRASSNTTLLTLTGIVLGGSGANRTVTLTPAATRTGTATVTLTVSDGSRTATDTFVLTVTDLLPIEAWRQTQFGANATNPAIAGDLVSPDGDVLVNLLEYALGGNPNSAASAPAPTVAIAGDKLALTFTRVVANTDLTLTVQAADSLSGPWTDLARSTAGATTTVLAAGAAVTETGSGATRSVEVRDLFNTIDPLHRRRCLRLKVTH